MYYLHITYKVTPSVAMSRECSVKLGMSERSVQMSMTVRWSSVKPSQP